MFVASDKPAVIMAGSEVTVTYRELDEGSKRLAQLLRSRGLQPGDHLAVLLENHPRYFEVYWAAMRAGLYCTPVNWHLRPEEAGYVIADCNAAAVITSAALESVGRSLEPHLDAVITRLVLDGEVDGWEDYETAVAKHAPEPLPDETEGGVMFYSSGTTGRPKGIKPPLSGAAFGTAAPPQLSLLQHLYGFDQESVYLCPAPLYHAAPLTWSTSVQRLGGTVVVMPTFDASDALAAIERHQVSHAQFVPTHFIRMLKLDEAERSRCDLSSLRVAVHAAAPCPVEVKRQMLDWWGPIIHEYYAGSEANGLCIVGPDEWLSHPGTVGRPAMGTVHVLDDEGVEVPPGQTGQIWFESPTRFEYHNDPEKTADAFNDRGWSSLGDIGHIDADGFVYLTDRASHMIISGGVNIYPQEIEDQLALHPAVDDVAVIGISDDDFGERVLAIIVPAPDAGVGAQLADELIQFCRERLASYKCPTGVDFVTSLPRLPTGKLLKRELRLEYATRSQLI